MISIVYSCAKTCLLFVCCWLIPDLLDLDLETRCPLLAAICCLFGSVWAPPLSPSSCIFCIWNVSSYFCSLSELCLAPFSLWALSLSLPPPCKLCFLLSLGRWCHLFSIRGKCQSFSLCVNVVLEYCVRVFPLPWPLFLWCSCSLDLFSICHQNLCWHITNPYIRTYLWVLTWYPEHPETV